ncbi:hypothetical protein DRP53_07530 [candidate division WOR-3 bacterium]|uniref:Helix-hairpin-helix DNA-binding motif class 1 domain-containing protein n=1 Tax=candidate division WOR-3 bacterium TaxID=2052148 RepID=A0A660SFR6_UNCW3|nr:MAG: hypothetical protein DRP53_07530 [candidate division WOR-3 bacterium]
MDRERIVLIVLAAIFVVGLIIRMNHRSSIRIRCYRIDINQASLFELDALPGIGPKLAERIIRFRDSIGGFDSLGQLVAVKGISGRTLAKLKPYLKPLKEE